MLELRNALSFMFAYGFTRLAMIACIGKFKLKDLIALVILMNNYRHGNDHTTLVCEIIIESFPERIKKEKVLGLFADTRENLISALTTQIFLAGQEMEKDLPEGQFHPTEGELAMVTNQFVSTFFKQET